MYLFTFKNYVIFTLFYILFIVFTGKKLFCCETAKINFESILSTVGGENERIRAKEFMKNIIVLPDDATVTDTLNYTSDYVNTDNQIQFSPTKVLPLGGKIKERSKIIFRFGDRIQAQTVTANEGFVRSAKQKVNLLHKFIILNFIFCL